MRKKNEIQVTEELRANFIAENSIRRKGNVRYEATQVLKVARTTFLARGVDHHSASRVRNKNDRGARFKTRKTKRNMAARGFLRPRSLLKCWRRNLHIKEALPAGIT